MIDTNEKPPGRAPKKDMTALSKALREKSAAAQGARARGLARKLAGRTRARASARRRG